MPNKLTDNEIIKAWDILAKLDFFGGQRAGRELWNEKPVDVQNEDIKEFIKDIEFLKDLINRLQAENEKLKAYIQNNGSGWGLISHLEFCKNLKAEAYKECIEKVKAKATDIGVCDAQGNNYGGATVVFANELDNLLKEMVDSL